MLFCTTVLLTYFTYICTYCTGTSTDTCVNKYSGKNKNTDLTPIKNVHVLELNEAFFVCLFVFATNKTIYL